MIGENIKKIREEKGISLYKVWKKTNISYAYLHGLESGLHNNPSINKVMEIANALEVNMEDIINKFN